MEGGGYERIPAEAENDAASVGRPDPAEARPSRVEVEARPSQLGRGPDPDEHPEDCPGKRKRYSYLDGIVIVSGGSRRVRGSAKEREIM